MTPGFSAYDPCKNTDSDALSDSDRMESMRVLLADLRTSIEKQRHLIDVSRALLERS